MQLRCSLVVSLEKERGLADVSHHVTTNVRAKDSTIDSQPTAFAQKRTPFPACSNLTFTIILNYLYTKTPSAVENNKDSLYNLYKGKKGKKCRLLLEPACCFSRAFCLRYNLNFMSIFRPRLHGNGSKRNRTQIGMGRPCVYKGTDGTVPYRTAIRTQTGPPRK